MIVRFDTESKYVIKNQFFINYSKMFLLLKKMYKISDFISGVM